MNRVDHNAKDPNNGRTSGSAIPKGVCLQPRVARNELPWVAADRVSNPNGVVSHSGVLGGSRMLAFTSTS